MLECKNASSAPNHVSVRETPIFSSGDFAFGLGTQSCRASLDVVNPQHRDLARAKLVGATSRNIAQSHLPFQEAKERTQVTDGVLQVCAAEAFPISKCRDVLHGYFT